jgi:hypothetical protein
VNNNRNIQVENSGTAGVGEDVEVGEAEEGCDGDNDELLELQLCNLYQITTCVVKYGDR